MSKENSLGNGNDFDHEAGKYEKFPVICKTCNQEYTINAPVTGFYNDEEKQEFGKKAAENFECEFCKKKELIDRIAKRMNEEKNSVEK